MKKIVVLGGAVTGWTVACLLRKQFPSSLVSICVVEDDHFDHVGAEASHSAIHKFHELIGLGEKECVQNSRAIFGLGLCYQGWCCTDQHFTLASGQYGASLRGVPFSQLYTRARALGCAHNFDCYSLSAVAAQAGRFGHPPSDNQSIYAQIRYGLHLREDEYGQLLKSHAIAAGVDAIVANCVSVNLSNDGAIESIELDNQASIEGDIFFDCTGRARVLFNALVRSSVVDEPLAGIFDRCAWGFRTNGSADVALAGITIESHGYFKSIPLYGQEMLRYYFSSKEISSDEVVQKMQNLGVAAVEIAEVGFYRSEFPWEKNCIAMGAAACEFPETYISSLHLVRNSLVRFLDLFMSFELMEASAGEYNRLSTIEFNLVRELVELNFYLARNNSPLLDDYFLKSELSEAALHRFNLFRLVGRHPQVESNLLDDTEWAAFFLGNGVLPQAYEPALDAMESEAVVALMEKFYGAYSRSVLPMPMHNAYVEKLKKV